MLEERDWVLRLAKQIAVALARAFGLLAKKDRDGAQQVLEDACGEALGMSFGSLDFADADATVGLLGEPERALAWARILETMAAVAGDGEAGRRRLEQAYLVVEALRRLRPEHAEAAARLEHLGNRLGGEA